MCVQNRLTEPRRRHHQHQHHYHHSAFSTDSWWIVLELISPGPVCSLITVDDRELSKLLCSVLSGMVFVVPCGASGRVFPNGKSLVCNTALNGRFKGAP